MKTLPMPQERHVLGVLLLAHLTACQASDDQAASDRPDPIAEGGAPGAILRSRSEGCGTTSPQLSGDWILQPTLTVDEIERQYSVMLPTTYDPSRAYPVVFLFHGCGSELNHVPMDQVVGDDAILVRAVAARDNLCWNRDAADVNFFEVMVDELSDNFCVQETNRFAVGYSSGAWLVNLLECQRGDLLRATGTVAGGTPSNDSPCVGTVARLMIHDQDDKSNAIAGSITERDRLVKLNGCDPSAPTPEDPAPCARYSGCDPDYPVVWCETTGEGHDRRDDFAPEAFWNFFQDL